MKQTFEECIDSTTLLVAERPCKVTVIYTLSQRLVMQTLNVQPVEQTQLSREVALCQMTPI